MNKRKTCLYILCLVLLLMTAHPALSQQTDASEGKPSGGLLIVTPEKFHQALTDYINHKQRQLTVHVADIETILSQSEGADDPERLKRYLYSVWKKENIGYVLLVGDADVLPVRYMVLDRITPAAFDYAFYPSDLYYADLAEIDGSSEDWNAQKDSFHAGYYGEVRGEKNKTGPINFDDIDYIPDIAVG